MLYGAYAIPVGVTCHSTVRKEVIPKDVKIGMCFMLPDCNINEQITCHRYKYTKELYSSIDTDHSHHLTHNPIRNINIKGYYRVYSSMFDGNKSDTYMR